MANLDYRIILLCIKKNNNKSRKKITKQELILNSFFLSFYQHNLNLVYISNYIMLYYLATSFVHSIFSDQGHSVWSYYNMKAITHARASRRKPRKPHLGIPFIAKLKCMGTSICPYLSTPITSTCTSWPSSHTVTAPVVSVPWLSTCATVDISCPFLKMPVANVQRTWLHSWLK